MGRPSGDRFADVGGDVNGVVIAGDGNVVYLGSDPERCVSNGVRLLRSGQHSQALSLFQEALSSDADQADVYYLTAIAALEGKKAALASLEQVRRSEQLLAGALTLGDRGICHYFLAYLARSYYERKFLNPPLPTHVLLSRASAFGVTQQEIAALFLLLKDRDPFGGA